MSTSSARFGIAAATAVDPVRRGVVAEPVGAAGAVERREERRPGQRERVRRPVLGLDEPERAELGGAGERAQVVRHDARDVGVHDEHRAVSHLLERGRDRRPLAAAGIVDDLGAELARERARVRVLGDEQRPAGRDARGEHVPEHRERQLRPQLVRRVEAPLARSPRKGTTICAIG